MSPNAASPLPRAMRRVLLAALITLGTIAFVGMADLALAPEFKAQLWQLGTAVTDHFLVRVLASVAVIGWLLSVCAAAWQRSEREYERRIAEAETRPEALRAPCGELVRLPETKSDSGPRAMGDVA